MAYYKITLAVTGPVILETAESLNALKGDTQPFQTSIKFRNAVNGLHIEVKARGNSADEAREAAVYFIGQHLDILSFRVNSPLYLNPREYGYKEMKQNSRRIIEFDILASVVRDLPLWRQNRKAFLRSLSWYRKAMVSEDPVDEFMSYWAALEGVCSKCARNSERVSRGIINKICDCFDQVWGSSNQWKVIPNEAQWINEFQQIRNGIAHGFISVDIEEISKITKSLDRLKTLTHEFLIDWESQGLQEEPNQTMSSIEMAAPSL